MTVTASNLLQGPVALYTAAFGAAEPATISTEIDLEVWRDLGGTSDGLEVSVSDDYAQLTVDQLLMAPESRRTGRSVTAKSNLAEVTLDNLALAITQVAPAAASAGQRTLDLEDGLSAFQPTYFAILAEGFAPGGFRRRIIIRKALQTDETAQSYKKDDQTLIPVTFTAHYISSSIPSVSWIDATPTAA